MADNPIEGNVPVQPVPVQPQQNPEPAQIKEPDLSTLPDDSSQRTQDQFSKVLDNNKKLMDANIEFIAVENPISVLSTRIRKPEQISGEESRGCLYKSPSFSW